METSNASPKKRLKLPKKSDQPKTKVKKRQTGLQIALQFLRQPDPNRDKREREIRRKSIIPEILMIEGVAELLGCSVQRVRSIPNDELPRRVGGGKCDLFLKEDVISYIRAHPKAHVVADDLMREIENEELESVSDSGSRRRGKRRNSDV